MKKTNRLLALIAALLFAHLVKDAAIPAFAEKEVFQKVVIVGIEKALGERWESIEVKVKK
jgi:hypothetical protein